MELYEAINTRKTTREFLKKEVDFEVIKRILEAGNKAPTLSLIHISAAGSMSLKRWGKH